jgi:hypothetical protein
MGKGCPKHVELILEISKSVIVASRWFSVLLYIYSMFNNFYPPEDRAFCETLWRNLIRVRTAADDNIIQRKSVARWVTKATDVH